ncbi:hypothetical protein BSIN_3953 [Burkholderia singularis]|uniref:Uncharacterized protein n=1 Tax=Burkholderia singularis TaxID=1503053 RepID=A0A238H6Z8_9BURK|nr:hypothetical protein BSIN_3953 [Burkholderia singularis]
MFLSARFTHGALRVRIDPSQNNLFFGAPCAVVARRAASVRMLRPEPHS